MGCLIPAFRGAFVSNAVGLSAIPEGARDTVRPAGSRGVSPGRAAAGTLAGFPASLVAGAAGVR